MKSLYLILISFLSTYHLHAQDNKFSILPTIGITSPFLDNGLGFHIGINPSIRLTERFSAEGQVSYIYNKISSSFISADKYLSHSVNTLLGGRFYLNSEDKKARLFINLLTSLNYNKEEVSSMSSEDRFRLGFSTGAFVDFNNIVIGVSYDTPANLIIKAGYSF